ncbi:MAG: membrane dipeptidase [Pseudomonadota bacterium]
MTATPVFDGHNDVLLRLWLGRPDAIAGFAAGSDGHIDLPRARAGGFAGGFFAIFVPGDAPIEMDALRRPTYDVPLPPEVPTSQALKTVTEQAAILLELDRRGDAELCRTSAEVEAAIANGRIAAVMHLEGAEAIGPDLAALDVLYAAGLRSLGPVWSRETIFGTGVPFRYPSDGDIGPGLTEEGRRLIARAAALKMIVDVSHLNMAGFHDVAEAGLPVIATHSNVHSVCPSSRNLTDDQLRVIGQSGGMVGLNFATAFLRPDGQMRADGAVDWMVRHLDRMIALAGEDHVGLGSDFDGGTMPEEIGDVAGLGALRGAMRDAGYGPALVEKICRGNWIAAMRRIWGS